MPLVFEVHHGYSLLENHSQYQNYSEDIAITTPHEVVLIVANHSTNADRRIWAQRPLLDRDVASWKKLDEDKEDSSAALRNTIEAIPEPINSAIEYAATNEQNPYFLWPSYVVSVTDGWISKGGKGSVVLIGDAAHWFPPHGVLGAGMALEDDDGLRLAIGDLEIALNNQERLSL